MGWCQAVFLTCDPQSTSHRREKEINWTTSKLKPLGLQRALKKVTKQRIKWESSVQFSCSVTSDFVILWTAAHQPSLSITNSRSLLRPMSIESVMPSSRLILLSAPPPPAPTLSQHQGLFKRVSSSHQVAKELEFQLQHQNGRKYLQIII